METDDRINIMLDILNETAQEENERGLTLPAVDAVLASLSPLPGNALFLGMANDGLPILLNLYDPAPGAILIAGDEDSGKTRLLQVAARAAEMLHDESQIQYAVVTESLDEWRKPENSHRCIGIYKPNEEASELLKSLVEWAHINKGEARCFVLLIDDLAALMNLDEGAKQNLRWLLMRGANRRVWIFATLNTSRAKALGAWLDFFRTRLFGFIASQEDAEVAAGNTGKVFSNLSQGVEFTMPEGETWLDFWLPEVEK